MRSAGCVHAESPEYDTACAVSALKQAFNNVLP
jgi:hypothetical protein